MKKSEYRSKIADLRKQIHELKNPKVYILHFLDDKLCCVTDRKGNILLDSRIDTNRRVFVKTLHDDWTHSEDTE